MLIIFYKIFKKFKNFISHNKTRFLVYIYKNKRIKKQFIIEDIINLDENIAYKKNHFNDFKIKLNEFKSLLKDNYNFSSLTIYKFGDGDYFFLNKIEIGSATPGIRALSKNYNEISHSEFINNSKKNDIYTCEIINPNWGYFYKCFSKYPDYYAEFNYILIANKWIFKNFDSIGLIGAKEKLNIIKELIKRDEYQKFLGITRFSDYINIPQKFACDDPKYLENEIKRQLSQSKTKIYLCGLGHFKNYILCKLPSYHKAIYLDIGAGIDAIAGIINNKRPYFGNWINYQIKNKELYKNIDYMHYNSSEDKLKKIIK